MKNKNSMLKIAALAACLLPAVQGALQAGAPLKINFQGRLDESGQPAAGSKTFVFKLYDAASDGNLVWTSQSQVLPLTQGVFSAALDAGLSAGLSTATFSGARYVEITVDGVILSPRQEMVSAPYALVAQALAPDAVLPPPAIAAGSISDSHVLLTTAAITSGKFSDDRLSLSTGSFYGGFNGADQLVQLTPAGKLPVLDGSALTNVPASSYSGSVTAAQVADGALGANVVASSVAVNKVHGAALQAGAVTDDKVLLSTAAISSGKFGDDRVSISTGAFPGGFNGADQLAKLETSGRLGVSTGTINSILSVGGAISMPIRTVNNSSTIEEATLNETDNTVLAAASSAGLNVYLPSAVNIKGRIYTIKTIDDTNPVYVVPVTGQTLDGWTDVNKFIMDFKGDFVTCQSDGANWVIIGVYQGATTGTLLWAL